MDGYSTEPLMRLLVAALSGMLIGIEREKARAAVARNRKRRPGLEEFVVKEFPGLRTFTLVAVFSSIVAYLWDAGRLTDALTAVLLAIFGLVVVVFSSYRLIVARMAGITTIIVLLVDFMVGFLSGLGEILLAASTAVLTTFLLAIKLPAEKVVGRIRYEEILWALELGVVLVVLGPFFLASEVSVYGVSLRSLYLFFALVLATSYIGYVAARLKGGEGMAYAALLGGLANSEATISSMLRFLSQQASRLAYHITVLVNTAMILRNMFITAVLLAPGAGSGPAAAALLAYLASLAPAVPSWRAARRSLVGVPLEVENPLSFSAAFRSTLLYLVIAVFVYIIGGSAGGVYAAAVLGGFASSSAAIVAIVTSHVPQSVAATASIVATAAGALNKPFYAYTVSRDPETLWKVLRASVVQAAVLVAVYLPLSYMYPNLWKTPA